MRWSACRTRASTRVAAAFVQLRPGREITPEAIVGHCSGRIASFKVPRHVRIIEEWPMSATKIQKFRLRQELIEELTGTETPR